jgi:hypothetical protein
MTLPFAIFPNDNAVLSRLLLLPLLLLLQATLVYEIFPFRNWE